VSVDTLSLSAKLRSAALTIEQADAIAAAIGSAVMEGAATKADLASISYGMAGLRGEIGQARAEIGNSEARLETRIEAAQSKLIMWFIGTQLAFVALLGAMIKF
jgi:hypothetical protein